MPLSKRVDRIEIRGGGIDMLLWTSHPKGDIKHSIPFFLKSIMHKRHEVMVYTLGILAVSLLEDGGTS